MPAGQPAKPGRFPGGDWRQSLPAESDAILRRWEKDPRAVGSSARAAFRAIVGSAPAAEGSVYRGQETRSGAYWIMPLARQVEHFRSMIGTGRTIRFARYTSTSSRPEVAAGFGRTVFEFVGHQARSIGNSLHEAVMPPGTYEVVRVERGYGLARAPIDGRTMFSTEQVRVTVRSVEPGTAAAGPGNRQPGRVPEFPAPPGSLADPGRSPAIGRRGASRPRARTTRSRSPGLGTR
jgi:hypothetical protein